ncbi:uncharacterized protein LOC129001789 [Macrosteles quadrilineatus]|uniref:uncharacterized protein LOC129001789 n=1 Tax=Macrosteles quadrilineatus TaxID=74068 RepID=UPI0023E12EC8|nr:uncharacterized protein LOC129001789 [Macrosteles quadrilineatus]XP_054285209.1 uncharacterized protein LOC129001789 [Macrosteles quadrilineatus]
MVSEEELMEILKTTLRDNGQYGRIKADLMNQLMNALGMDKQQLIDTDKPQPPANISLVNQLILEYLNWAGYKFSEKMFTAEASVPATTTSRNDLKQELKLKECHHTEGLPLLLLLLSTMKDSQSNSQN